MPAAQALGEHAQTCLGVALDEHPGTPTAASSRTRPSRRQAGPLRCDRWSPPPPHLTAGVLTWPGRTGRPACRRRRRSNYCRSPGYRSTRPLGEIAARLIPGAMDGEHNPQQSPTTAKLCSRLPLLTDASPVVGRKLMLSACRASSWAATLPLGPAVRAALPCAPTNSCLRAGPPELAWSRRVRGRPSRPPRVRLLSPCPVTALRHEAWSGVLLG